MRRIATILIVEDDPHDRFFVQRIFENSHLPINLRFAFDGEDAVAYLSGKGEYHDRSRFPAPSLMLLDLKLPKTSGFEVLKWLKSQDGLKRLPVTVLSASGEQPDIDKAYELGANAYLIKPLRFEDFEQVYKKATAFFTMDAASPAIL